MDIKEDCFHLGVKALIYNNVGELLLLKINPIKLKDEKEVWDLPGGRIQRRETLEEALKREVYEETGLQDIINITPFMMTLSNIRIPLQNDDVGLIYAIYLCHSVGGGPICLSKEHVHFDWFTPNKAAKLLTNYPKEFMEKLVKVSLII